MTEPRLSRRRVITAGAATGALLLTGSMGLAGCTSSAPAAPEQPDPLELPARRAESDAALAQAVAAAYSDLAAVAGVFAADRRTHGAALRTELHRVRPDSTPSSSVAPAPAPVPTAADQTRARDALAGAAQAAQDEAAGLVSALPGYRAAMLASVAACCASHQAVLS